MQSVLISAIYFRMDTQSLQVLLTIACLLTSNAFRLTPDPRQEDAEEEATTLPTNNHLIGTLAGVLSSILRSGANATSPINFNLTQALQRLTRLQLFPSFPFPLPIFPSRPKQNHDISGPAFAHNGTDPLVVTPSIRLARKRLNYRNPTRKPLFGSDWRENEIQSNVVQIIQDDDDVKWNQAPPAAKQQNTDQVFGEASIPTTTEGTYVIPTVFPIYPVATTTEYNEVTEEETEEPEDTPDVTEAQRKPLAPLTTPAPPPVLRTQPTTDYPLLPIYLNTDPPSIDLKNLDTTALGWWLGTYLGPALKVAKDATKNLTVGSVVNGTTEGVKGFVNFIPTFAEAVSELVDYFNN